jgi:hypothetical protein
MDIESAREDIADTKQSIDDGDFVPQKRAKPKTKKWEKRKTVKKPSDGSRPNVRMLYRSMSDNEAEWEILVIDCDGKSFVGWSFEHEREFNFNVAGVIWAENVITCQRIANFETFLEQIIEAKRK